jgi:hypothetical protein
MPVRRTQGRARRYRISAEAAARWREVRPHGLHFSGEISPASYVNDTLLGELVGEPALLAMRAEDLQELYEALEEAIRAD